MVKMKEMAWVKIKWMQIFCWICFLMLFFSCSKDEDEPIPVDRTVLVYIAADNNLNSEGYTNIGLMLKGMEQIEGRLVIYIDPVDDVPCLLTIKGGRGCRLDTLRIYSEENSASPEVLARVIDETRDLYPASAYGLVLWSHGMGWLPSDYFFPGAYSMSVRREMPRTKYFGEDQHTGGSSYAGKMKIGDLAAALPEGFQFILFDACFMSSIEVLYELKDKTDYIIASPTEIISDGFPYDKVVPLMWGGEEDLKQMCREFYNYYNTHPLGGNYQSATIALVRTDGLKPLAGIVREVLSGKTNFVPVWRYPLSRHELPNVFFDLGAYVHQMASKEQRAVFDQEMSRTLVYKAATVNLFGKPIPADYFSGISTYIPLSQWANMNQKYNVLSWQQAVY
ncbi:MAG: clostripain-related cysteine peptidase [Odoribacter sp.]